MGTVPRGEHSLGHAFSGQTLEVQGVIGITTVRLTVGLQHHLHLCTWDWELDEEWLAVGQ